MSTRLGTLTQNAVSVCKQVEAECQWKPDWPRASGHVAVRTCGKAKKISLIYNINTEHGYWQEEDRRVENSSQHLCVPDVGFDQQGTLTTLHKFACNIWSCQYPINARELAV
jgi:hypothetical protein